MEIMIDKKSKIPIYHQIKTQISHMILSNVLPPHFILPPERILSESLEINRSTVVRAYMELKAEGLVASKQGSGTMVVPREEEANHYVPTMGWKQIESKRFVKNNDLTINNILSVFEKQEIISFASGIPSEVYYDLKTLAKFQNSVLEKYQEKLFMPTPVDGSMELKKAIQYDVREKGIHTHNKNIMVTSGSQQGIDFVGRFLLEAGDVVIMEEPSYPGAISAFESYGVRIIGIPMEQDGMRMDILENCLNTYRPKLIYTQPTFQNPTGITTSMEKRQMLLHYAHQYQIPVFEDNPYGEVRFEGETLPTLKSMDLEDYVIYASSFSKTISFSLRVGYIIANDYVIERFKAFKQITDIQTSTLSQLFVAELLQAGYVRKRVKELQVSYKQKRDLMLKCLDSLEVEGLLCSKPEGGFFIWCQLPQYLDMDKVLEGLSKVGVLIMPGAVFSTRNGETTNFMRLNFSYPTEEEIQVGVEKLGQVLREHMREKEYAKQAHFININPLI